MTTQRKTTDERAFAFSAFKDPCSKSARNEDNDGNVISTAAKSPSVRALFRQRSSNNIPQTVDRTKHIEGEKFPAIPNSRSMPYGYGVGTPNQPYNSPYEYRPSHASKDECYRIERTASGGLLMKGNHAVGIKKSPSTPHNNKDAPVPPEFNNPVYGHKPSKGMGHWIKKAATNVVVDVTSPRMTPNEAANKANAMMELQREVNEQEKLGLMDSEAYRKFNKKAGQRRNIVKQIFGPPAEKTEVKLVKLQRHHQDGSGLSKAATFDNGNFGRKRDADIQNISRAHTFENGFYDGQGFDPNVFDARSAASRASYSNLSGIVDSQSFDYATSVPLSQGSASIRDRAEEMLHEKNSRKPRRGLIKQVFGPPSEKETVKLEKLERKIRSQDSQDDQHIAALLSNTASPRRHGVQTLTQANSVTHISYLGASPSYDRDEQGTHLSQEQASLEEVVRFDYDAALQHENKTGALTSPQSVMKPITESSAFA